MQNLTYQEVFDYIESKIIEPFYEYKIKKLNELRLQDVLTRKNPYLFKAKNITIAYDYINDILQAFLSSQEETKFGKYLEELAIFICSKVYGGFKSSAKGIDLEFERDSKRYIVTIKSGPYWGNSSQLSQMRTDFKNAKKVLGANSSITNIIAVNGCCYGKDNQDTGEYLKLCGQEFWAFISGDYELYLKIIEPLDEEVKQKDEEFKAAYSRKVNLLTSQFTIEFCNDGNIDWNKLLKVVSSKPEKVVSSKPRTRKAQTKRKAE